MVGEFEKANLKDLVEFASDQSPEVWSPPPFGSYKLNTDAAPFENGRIGFGAVVRDAIGNVMVASCDYVAGNENVEIAEALAARHGLKVAWEAGLRDIMLEVDNAKLFWHLKKKKKNKKSFMLWSCGI